MVQLTVPVEVISVEARRVDPGKALAVVARVLGTLLLAVPYLLGWTLGKIWVGVTLLATAVVVGWREARKRPEGGST